MAVLLFLDTSALLTLRHSVADAWIDAAAHQVSATLMHKDPGFRAIADLPQEWQGLPFIMSPSSPADVLNLRPQVPLSSLNHPS